MDRITETERDARVEAFKEVIAALEASGVSQQDIGMGTAMNIVEALLAAEEARLLAVEWPEEAPR